MNGPDHNRITPGFHTEPREGKYRYIQRLELTSTVTWDCTCTYLKVYILVKFPPPTMKSCMKPCIPSVPCHILVVSNCKSLQQTLMDVLWLLPSWKTIFHCRCVTVTSPLSFQWLQCNQILFVHSMYEGILLQEHITTNPFEPSSYDGMLSNIHIIHLLMHSGKGWPAPINRVVR